MGPASTATRNTGAWALVLASLFWGTTGTAASFLPTHVSPLAIGASTMTVGGALLFAVSARPALRAIRDAASRRWLLWGALGVFAYPLAFYSSMDLTGVAIGNVVALGSGPVFAALLEWLCERRRLSLRWAVCTAVAVGGVVMLALGGSSAARSAGSELLGIGLGLVAGLAYALYAYCSSRGIRSARAPAQANAQANAQAPAARGVMGGMFGLGSILLLPVLLVFGAPLLQSGQTIGIAAYLAVVPMFVAYLLFGIGIRTMNSSAATTITLVEPVVATLLAVFVVGERLAPIGWVGLVLILGAVTALAMARTEP